MRDCRRLVWLVILVSIAAAGLVAGCAPAPPPKPSPVRVDASADGTTVSLKVGQTFEVALPGNVTTGYDWGINGMLPSQVTTSTDSYESTAPAGVMGAGGVHTFVYTAATPGTGMLRLMYSRSFEEGVAPSKVFNLTVVVQ